MRPTWSFAAVLTLTSVAAAHAQEFTRYHFKQPVTMRLDASRVAVLSAAGDADAAKVPGFTFDPSTPQLPLPRWRLLSSDKLSPPGVEVAPSVAVAAAGGKAEFVSPVFLDDRGDPIIVTQDLLIGVRQDVPADRAREIASKFGDIVQEGVGTIPNSFKVRSGSRDGAEVLRQANQLAVMDEVVFAEPDMIATTRDNLVPNDPLFPNCWGLRNTGQLFGSVPGVDLGAVEAWDTTTGLFARITVVIDGGVQSAHPDLAGRILTPGFDATGQGGAGEPVSPCDSHGTAVAGCIVAKINNGLGTVGIAPNTVVASARSRIPNVPCNGTGTFQFSWIADSLAWAQSIGARVTNISLALGATSSIIDAAYQSTYNAGIIHFASAGNDSNASTVSYPASIPVVNAVAALDPNGARSAFSNSGSGLDFIAPGSSIATTDRTGADGYVGSDYVFIDGTSFAAPYAAGVAALILSQRPSLLPAQVEAIMRSTARDLGAFGYDSGFGYGLVRADGAMRAVNGQCPLTWEEQFASLPTSRAEHGSAYDSSRNTLVVFGGNTSGTTSGETWEFAAGVWRRVSTSGPSSRKNVMMVYDSSRQRTVLFGGFSSAGALGDTWEWNGSVWSQPNLTGPTPPARRTGSMAFDSQRGRVVLYGGFSNSGAILGDTWEFDGSSWTLASHPGPPIPRYAASMAFDSSPGRNVCVLFGGLTPGGYVNETWEWNGLNWVQRTPPSSPSPRAGQTSMAFDPTRSRCVIFGGESSGGVTLNDLWEFDGSSWLSKTIPLPLTRYGNSMAFDSQRNQTLLFGGAPDGNNVGSKFSDLWAFDGSRWIPITGPAPSPRFGTARIFAPELGGAVMFGGVTALNSPNPSTRTNEMWLQSPTGWGRLDSGGPSARAYSSIGVVDDYGLILFGGLVGSGQASNELWRFTGGAWSQFNAMSNPDPTYGAASCVFSNAGKFVVFGGSNDGPLSNTLHVIAPDSLPTWQHFPGGGPSARENAMMAYDPVRDEAILFGGLGSGGFDLDDIWRLRFVNGNPEWTQMGSLGIIQGWSGGSMFWDPGRQRIVLYAKRQFGFDQNAFVEPTVYEWTGSTFVPIAGDQLPSLRQYASMGPTSASGDIRLFGGLRLSDSTILGDTWAFNGVPEPDFPVGPNGGGTFDRGSTITLTAPLILGQSPTLRWHRAGVPLFNGVTPAGSVISGADTPTLVITNAQSADAGLYTCVATNPCGTSTSAPTQVVINVPCLADFNGQAGVTVQDIFDYLAAYFAGCTATGVPVAAPPCYRSADINGASGITVQDIFDYLAAYFAGCP